MTQTLYADERATNEICITTTGAWNSTIETTAVPAVAMQQQRSYETASAWISISPDRGNNAGDYTIQISLEVNTTGADRTAQIIILCGDEEVIITVTQSALTEDGKVPTDIDDPDNPDYIPATGIKLSKSRLVLPIGDEYNGFWVFLTPTNATYNVTWTSSNENVATVVDGKITAISVGRAIITAKAGNNVSTTCSVVVADAQMLANGVVINDVLWAKYNVFFPGTFATELGNPGMLYQWNHNIGWFYSHFTNSNGNSNWDFNFSLSNEWEKSNDPSPTGWRIPNYSELSSLFDTEKVDNEWVNENAMVGRKFIDKTSGNSIFLPAVGCREYANVTNTNVGYYWYSDPELAFSASYLKIYSYYYNDTGIWFDPYNGEAFNIRSVVE